MFDWHVKFILVGDSSAGKSCLMNKYSFDKYSDENPITINKAADLVAGSCKTNLSPMYVPDRPQEVKVATCSSDKARALLDYETTTTTFDAIEQTVEYIKLKGPREFDYSFGLEIENDKTPITWLEKLM